ncbi:uncharacterized protein LOC117183153 isoform X2 [Belonocnema kinseyi]|nr:uncharacterized protein LOC117183153 isoform X2 [Belonocnema kinseyi]
MFVCAHISRRHPTLSEAFTTSSPVQEEYRAETEKLHNEIKTLKERLNQTERVIRNESNKASLNVSTSNGFKHSEFNSLEQRNDNNQDFRMEEQHKRYQEEISSLKILLFSELRNLKQTGLKDIGFHGLYDNDNVNIKELIRQQENEIQKLGNQVHDNVTSDLESIYGKLLKQDEYWKIKLEHLESQHHADIENVIAQLKLTQETANRMTRDYESKINDLQNQCICQSQIFTAQNEHLSHMSRGVQDAHSRDHSECKRSSALKYAKHKYSKSSIPSNIPESCKKIKMVLKGFNEKESSKKAKKAELIFEYLDSVPSQEQKKPLQEDSSQIEYFSSENLYSRAPEKKTSEIKIQNKMKKSFESGFVTVQDFNSVLKSALNEGNLDRKLLSEEYSEDTIDLSEFRDDKFHRSSMNKNNLEKFHSQATKSNQSEESELSSEKESEPVKSVSETEELSSESLYENPEPDKFKSPISKKFNKKIQHENPLALNEQKNNLKNNFGDQLRKLGIDPEWNGIPNATYKEKFEILKHQKKLNSKKFLAYEEISKKLLSDVSKKLSLRQNQPKKYESAKIPLINRMISNVKSRTIKALKIRKSLETETPVMRSRNSTPEKTHAKQQFGMDILRRKLSEFDIRELKRDKGNWPLKERRMESQNDSRSTPTRRRSSIDTDQIINGTIQNTKNFMDSNISLKKLSHSYESTEDFFEQTNEEYRKSNPTLDMTSAKVTSTPNRNLNNIMQDSYFIDMNLQETIRSFSMSPKNNKSVLKSATGSVGSMVKKKVIFDLKNSPDKDSMQIRSLGEILTEHDPERKKFNDSDWNISSISDKKDQTFENEKSKSMDNIFLKTSQNDKIAQISKRIEKQLSIARKKPVGSIETMFIAKSPYESFNQQDQMYKNTSATNSIWKNAGRPFEDKYNIDNKEPQVALSTSKKKDSNAFISSKKLPCTKDFDLDIDINELLEIELSL